MTALGGTPKRLLFRNDCVQLVLVGLSAGQELKEFSPGTSLLMVVTYGRVMVRTGNRTHKLLEGEQYQVLPTGNYEVRSGLSEGDIILRNPSSSFKEGQTAELVAAKPPTAAASAASNAKGT